MNRDLISTECCYAGDLPDYWGDEDGMIWPERRSRRARIFRSEARHHFRWSAAVIVFLIVVLGIQRWAFDRAVGWRDAEIERLKAKPVKVEGGCTAHAETPVADTVISESCIRTVYRF